jgi:LysM repeat protein
LKRPQDRAGAQDRPARAIAAICRLFSPADFASSVGMWKVCLIGCAIAGAASGQTGPSQIEFANLREDVRGLTQRTGELQLRIEQLERENNDLKLRANSGERAGVTLTQLNEAIADVNRNLRAAITESKTETLQHVAGQMEKLARETQAAIDSLAKSPAGRTGAPGFAENYPKEGVSYTVQKGETLAVIAKKTGAKQQDIINANKISDPSHIVVGQTLFIPGGK